MGLFLKTLKSNKRLQTDALDILRELIRRKLLSVDILVESPLGVISSRVVEAYVEGSYTTTGEEIVREIFTGEAPNNKRFLGPGIALRVRGKFRLDSTSDGKFSETDIPLKGEGPLEAIHDPVTWAQTGWRDQQGNIIPLDICNADQPGERFSP